MAKMNYERVNRENNAYRKGTEYLDTPPIGSYTDVKINKAVHDNRAKKNNKNIQLITCPRCKCKIKATNLEKHLDSRCPGKREIKDTKKATVTIRTVRKPPISKKQSSQLAIKKRGYQFRKGYWLLEDEILNLLKIRDKRQITKDDLLKEICDSVRFLPRLQLNNLIEILLYTLLKSKKVNIEKKDKSEEIIKLI